MICCYRLQLHQSKVKDKFHTTGFIPVWCLFSDSVFTSFSGVSACLLQLRVNDRNTIYLKANYVFPLSSYLCRIHFEGSFYCETCEVHVYFCQFKQLTYCFPIVLLMPIDNFTLKGQDFRNRTHTKLTNSTHN